MRSVRRHRPDAHAEAVVELAQALLQLRLRPGGALLLALVGLHARRPFAPVQVGLLLTLLELDLEIARAREPAALVVRLRALPAFLLGRDAFPRTRRVGPEAALQIALEVGPAALGRGAEAGALIVTSPLHALPGLAPDRAHPFGRLV